MKIYTKTGDQGETSLIGGSRVPKSHARLEAYGTVDELNSLTGLLRSHCDEFPAVDATLEVIQHRLFQVGSHLACENETIRSQLPKFEASWSELLETKMDEMSESLPPLKNFILPGGSEAACRAHICRTVCRRAERKLFAIGGLADTEKEIGRYLNRLSDYFFVLARWFNLRLNVEDVIWRKDI
jgi:cob(I)alamin adenosyltransferase